MFFASPSHCQLMKIPRYVTGYLVFVDARISVLLIVFVTHRVEKAIISLFYGASGTAGKESHALHIVCDVLQANGNICPIDSDTSQVQPTDAFLDRGEDMFDACTHARVRFVDLFRISTQHLPFSRFLQDPVLCPICPDLLADRFTCIGLVRVDFLARIFVLIEQNPGHHAVMGAGGCDLECLYQFVLACDLHLILVAKVSLAVLLRPCSLGIVLPLYGGLAFPFRWDLSLLERLLLGFAQMLLRGVNDAGIDDRISLQQQSLLREHRLEGIEQFDYNPGVGELVPEFPDFLLVGDSVVDAKSKETLERETIKYHELGLAVCQIIDALQDQNLEHHHVIICWASAGSLWFLSQCFVENLPEYLPVNNLGQTLERVTMSAESLQTVVFIEKSRAGSFLAQSHKDPRHVSDSNIRYPYNSSGFLEVPYSLQPKSTTSRSFFWDRYDICIIYHLILHTGYYDEY